MVQLLMCNGKCGAAQMKDKTKGGEKNNNGEVPDTQTEGREKERTDSRKLANYI